MAAEHHGEDLWGCSKGLRSRLNGPNLGSLGKPWLVARGHYNSATCLMLGEFGCKEENALKMANPHCQTS